MFAASKTAAVSGAAPDSQFNYVTMLLHGDGTNGAQNNTFVDSSTNNFTITRNGNTTQGSFSPYGSNWSNYFDGTGDYLATSSTQIIPASTTYTVEAWVYLTGDYSDYREIVTQGSSGNANRWLMFVNITDGILKFQTGSSSITTSFTVPKNTWTHLAFVNNGGSYTVYANGTSVGSGSNSVTPQNTYVTVGAFQSGAEYFQGYISNVRITNTAVYTSAFTPSTTPLTAISGTSFLTCQSNRFIDNSANTYAITAYGNSSVQRFNPFGASTAYSTSVIGGSGYFDGSGDYLTAPDNNAFEFGSGNFTIEAWAYPLDGGFQMLVAKSPDNSATGWQFFASGDELNFYASTGGSWNVGFFSSGAPIKRNAWNHLAVTRNGSTWTIWVNGVSQATATSSITINNNTLPVAIGAFTNASYFSYGYTADVRIVKGTAVYTSNFTPPTAPLTAISGTSLLLSTTNGAIYDNAMMNDLETVGNAQISTSVYKYGTGSMYFDETGDYITVPPSPNMSLGTGDFTIECWVRFAANPVGNGQGVYQLTNGYLNNTIRGPACGVENSTGGWTIYYGTTYTISGTVPTTGVWYHTAYVRSSGTTKLYIDGTSIISVADTTNYTDQYFTIGGWYDVAFLLNGYIDDLRITKGYARYTANFTPPTAAFLNTGPI